MEGLDCPRYRRQFRAMIHEPVWSRVSLKKAHVWIPAQSTKGGRAIGTALSEYAVRVLNGIDRIEGEDHVF
jgi:hypothetical protein